MCSTSSDTFARFEKARRREGDLGWQSADWVELEIVATESASDCSEMTDNCCRLIDDAEGMIQFERRQSKPFEAIETAMP